MTQGENNPRAVLSDAEVDMLRDLYEGDRGKPRGDRYWTGPRLAEKFEITLRSVRYILSYERRAGANADDNLGEPEEREDGRVTAEPRGAGNLQWVTTKQIRANARSKNGNRKIMARWKHEETPKAQQERVPRDEQ